MSFQLHYDWIFSHTHQSSFKYSSYYWSEVLNDRFFAITDQSSLTTIWSPCTTKPWKQPQSSIVHSLKPSLTAIYQQLAWKSPLLMVINHHYKLINITVHCQSRWIKSTYILYLTYEYSDKDYPKNTLVSKKTHILQPWLSMIHHAASSALTSRTASTDVLADLMAGPSTGLQSVHHHKGDQWANHWGQGRWRSGIWSGWAGWCYQQSRAGSISCAVAFAGLLGLLFLLFLLVELLFFLEASWTHFVATMRSAPRSTLAENVLFSPWMSCFS